MIEKLRSLIGMLSKGYITHRKCFLMQSQKCGLYVGQPQILNYVYCHPGCTQNEIAAYLGVSAASVAFSTKRLQAAGLLQKQVNSLNMRCNKLYVNPEGVDVLTSFSDDFDKLNLAMFEGFTEEELDQLVNITERVSANMEKFLKKEQAA